MTIYDIAKLAGTSASTVSRVVNNKHGVKNETREKIQKLLDEYDYIPDENARGLITKSTKLIGIVMPDIRNTHHAELAYIVEKNLKEHNYCSIILNAGIEPDVIVENIGVLVKRKVDGIILVGSVFENKKVEERLSKLSIPVAFANGYLENENIYGVLVNEEDAVKDAVNYLFENGKRNIAFLGKIFTSSSKNKYNGYKKGLKINNLENEIFIEIDELDYNVNDIDIKFILSENPNIDAIICSEDVAAVSIIRELNKNNIKIPKDIAVIGINNSTYGKLSYPSLTSIDNKMVETGLIASNIIIDLLSGKEASKKTFIESDIIKRESTSF